MPSTTIYYDFWLPTGDHYESTAAGDTNYENLLTRWAQDVGSSQYHNLVTQYYGNNGGSQTFITNNVTFGGSWVDTAAYPHTGSTTDPLQDSDIQNEVHNAVTTNGWTEDISHIVAVFTATGIQECDGTQGCTFTKYCAYHSNFTDSSNDALYAFMGFDNFVHQAGKTCVAGQTGGDNDPNRGNYPNGDVNADAEINTLSHEAIEAETDPHPNATWTGPLGEIGDACNFNFSPRNSIGADLYINGHPYIVQQEWSNAISTCGIDLATNGFCTGSVSSACSPSTSYTKIVDNSAPYVDSTINYTLTLNNTNDTGAETNLTIADSPPSGYAISDVTAPGASSPPTFNSTSATVDFDSLPVHQSQTITISATVPEQAGTTATNCGSKTSSDLIGTTLPTKSTNPCASTTPVKIPTSLTYTGATTSDFHDQATVSATLTDVFGNPVSGKLLSFTLNGTENCTGTTDGSGSASCPITPGEAAGPYTLAVSFGDTSDPKYATTSISPTFTVTKEETTTAYTGPSVILSGGGSTVTLTGRLLEDGTTPISGRTLTLGVSGQTCPGISNATGVATCNLTFTGSLGSQALSAVFAGDAYYLPSSDTSHTAIVFAFPTNGAFSLGDKTVKAATPTTTVTWWADIWNQLNSETGGPAPSSFKGFAENLTNMPTSTPPTSCGGNWTTLPGNSPPPTAGVPSYMGVMVTSKVAKSGNVVSGTTVHIVVVKTNPGYAPNPMNYGTGTIVATFC